ncbi:cytochrome P450 [Rhizopogon salebrosus TDB-379]|nr:cytochrome P450 [Rhizopogon salebrosus TDB-379]
MAGDLAGWGNSFFLQQYGERFQQSRTMFHKLFGSPDKLRAFHPIRQQEAQRFVRDVLNVPGELADHVRKAVGTTILKISYGYEVQAGKDPLIELAEKAMKQFADTLTPGTYSVDVIPILKYLPSWFPGASFQKTARLYRQTLWDLVDIPFNMVLEQIASGTAPYSFTSSQLEGRKLLSPDEDHVIKWSALAMHTGGTDTTVSAIYAFFLAMTIHPEIQARAQTELDSVVGTDRLPTFDDRDSLPYINAICKEVFRWNVIAPLAIPHVASQDNVHNGYLIPKGSVILANVWQILHDEDTYPNPEVFDPTRFTGSDPQPDPRNACFGYGRRLCPGASLADESLFIYCATSLAALHIKKYIEDGKEVTPTLEQTDSTIWEARDLVKIDVNKTSRVWDFLVQAGFLKITPDPPHAAPQDTSMNGISNTAQSVSPSKETSRLLPPSSAAGILPASRNGFGPRLIPNFTLPSISAPSYPSS